MGGALMQVRIESIFSLTILIASLAAESDSIITEPAESWPNEEKIAQYTERCAKHNRYVRARCENC